MNWMAICTLHWLNYGFCNKFHCLLIKPWIVKTLDLLCGVLPFDEPFLCLRFSCRALHVVAKSRLINQSQIYTVWAPYLCFVSVSHFYVVINILNGVFLLIPILFLLCFWPRLLLLYVFVVLKPTQINKDYYCHFNILHTSYWTEMRSVNSLLFLRHRAERLRGSVGLHAFSSDAKLYDITNTTQALCNGTASHHSLHNQIWQW